jgi:hypothetical protein
MPAKKITLAKVEMARFALKELMACVDVPPDRRAELARALAVANSLAPTGANMADHSPVLYAPGIIGCKCGFRPAKFPGRASTMMSPYHSHLAKIGCPRSNAPVLYGYGAQIGQRAY